MRKVKKIENTKINENIKQIMLYLIVGSGATIVEWIVFFLFDHYLNIHYMIATSLAFVLSTFANWVLGRLIMFKSSKNTWKELVQIYLVSIAGLLMNLMIMWIAITKLGFNNMFSKIAATGIVFFWNFIIRKLLIYRN
ncbi:GtrA family protein [Lachnospiraceae bacterium]|jgi:putative flippase GtrA|nr:GtrA family protein [uncultured Schaedlerella sp.]EOS39917.1 hypothetical protein C808_00887 [Lachnospiraceae bacterium M18-1]NBI60547.1 GtrA family protein [Lachnospiraceae bacterium]